jgi:hypothetical protein
MKSAKPNDCAMEIVAALSRDVCTVIQSGNHYWDAKDKDSSVMGVPPIDLEAVLNPQRSPSSSDPRRIQAGVSIVRIEGPALDVESHYHIAHLVGLVVTGNGWLNVPKSKAVLVVKNRNSWVVSKDLPEFSSKPQISGSPSMSSLEYLLDVVVLPKKTYHVFRCSSRRKMEYIALEFSDQKTDYQAHH